jgi:flagellar export protein FliJ
MSVLRRLVRYRRHLLDEKRREVRELEERAVAIDAAIADLDANVAAEQRFGRRSADAFSTYGSFARASLERRAALLADLSGANAAVDRARDELLDMFAEAKRYEIGLEQQLEAERQVLERRAQEALDEAALNQYRRRVAE